MQNIPQASVNSVFELFNDCFISEQAICSINVWLAVKYCFWSSEFKPAWVARPIKLWLLVHCKAVSELLNGKLKRNRTSHFIGCLEVKLTLCLKIWITIVQSWRLSKCVVPLLLVLLLVWGPEAGLETADVISCASCWESWALLLFEGVSVGFLCLIKGTTDGHSKFYIMVNLKCIFYNMTVPLKRFFTAIYWNVSSCSFLCRDPVV